MSFKFIIPVVYTEGHIIIIVIIINILIVQYLMQFSGPPRNIGNSCSAPLCAGNVGSTDTTRVHAFHALLLSSKHY